MPAPVKAKAKAKAKAKGEPKPTAGSGSAGAGLELPDFMHEPDGDGDELDGPGDDSEDVRAKEARYDASYNAFMDELDNEDDDIEQEGEDDDADESAAPTTHSLSVFSTSLLPNHSRDDDNDGSEGEGGAEDEFNLFAPRRVQPQVKAQDVRDAEDPMYAERLADILGSDDDDEEEEEEEEEVNIVPSPSALEDLYDEERVEAELSMIDPRDTTVETGLDSAEMEEDDDDDDDEDGFVYTPSKEAEEEEEDEDEDDEDGFVYRPSASSSDIAPQLPPIHIGSSTPPPAPPIPLPDVHPKPSKQPSSSPTPAPASTAVVDPPPTISLTAVDPELSLDLNDDAADMPSAGGSTAGSASASILSLPRRNKALPSSLKVVRPKLLTPSGSGSVRSWASFLGSSAAPTPLPGSHFLSLPSASTTFGATSGVFDPYSALSPSGPVLPSSSIQFTERDILRLSSMRKIGAKLYQTQQNGGTEAVIAMATARGLGTPTVLAAGNGVVAVGTTRGWTLIFALDQELRCVVGTESIAKQGGSVTALNFSLDSTFVGVGHAAGHIALYDLQKPSVPARQVSPVSFRSVQAGRKEGHLPGCAIVQLGFVGKRHTAIVTADAAGVAVYHALGKILGVSSNDTLRIFGQYPSSEPSLKVKDVDLEVETRPNGSVDGSIAADTDTASINGVDLTQPRRSQTAAPSSKSILFGVQPLPLGSTTHLADAYQFVAILTPHKLVLVGLKPAPRTWWRKTAPRRQQNGSVIARSAEGWNAARTGVAATSSAGASLPDDLDFADGLEVGDGVLGLGVGSSPLRLVRGIPEGRTPDDFVMSLSVPNTGEAVPEVKRAEEGRGWGDGEAHDEDDDDEEEGGALCGAMAWLPASELPTISSSPSSSGVVQHVHPVLAFSFGKDLFFLHLVKGRRQIRRAGAGGAGASNTRGSRRSQANGGSPDSSLADTSVSYEDHLGLQEEMALVHKRTITGLQWLNPDLLLILDTEGLNLFDLRVRRCTERQRLPDFRAVTQRWDTEGVFHPVRQSKSSPSTSSILALTASHSFRVFDGRAFLLGAKDFMSGTALSWTDRLLSLVSAGDLLAAIELAQKYYEGHAPGSVIGLPSDRAEQKRIVGRKLRDLMFASAAYAFSPVRLTDNTHVTPDGRGVDRTPLFEGLARVCALACLALDDLGSLFGELYEQYADNGIEGIFVGQMEEFIISGRMRTLPVDVVQRLVAFRKSTGDYALAERIIYHVDPLCLDLDQAIGLCLEQHLYDALTYVYTEAIDDFVGPLVEFVGLMKRVVYESQRQDGDDNSVADESGEAKGQEKQVKSFEQDTSDAYTLFSYLSAGLLGLAYPSRKPYAPERATQAKRALYGFLFAGSCVMWPKGPGGRLVLSLPDDVEEPTYPYLRLILHFDADALLEVLEVAFEDSFLNDDDDDDGGEEDGGGGARRGQAARVHTRQKVVDLLLDIAESEAQAQEAESDDEDDEDEDKEETDTKERESWSLRTSVSMFVARNAPKFPQFISLTPAQVDAIFGALTSSTSDVETHEERQLATEYLLSSYKVADGDRLLELLEQAGFWRLLQDALRRERRWDRLVEIYVGELRTELDDAEEGEEGGVTKLGDEVDVSAIPERPIFGQLEQVLSRAIRERTSWLDELGPRITEATPTLLRADVIRTVALIERFFPARHHEALEELAGNELAQLAYLRCFYDPAYTRGFATATTVGDEAAATQTQTRARTALELLSVGERLEPANRDRYIALLARHRPDDLVQAFDAQPWAEYIDLENGGRFLFDKHFGSKALGGSPSLGAVAGGQVGEDGEKKEPLYREVKPFLDGMTSAYRLRIELLGMANRLFDRDLFGDLDRLAAKRVRGWRPKAAISGPLSSSVCGACGETLISAGSVGPLPSGMTAGASDGKMTTANGERTPRPRLTLRDRQRSASVISLPPPRPPSSPFIEHAAGGPAKPDKGKGVSRGYFPVVDESESPSLSLPSMNSGLLSPDGLGIGQDGSNGRARRLRSISPQSHSQLRAMSMGGGGGNDGIPPPQPIRSASSTPLLGAGAVATLSPALGLGVRSASVFEEMQASDTQPADLFAADTAALGLPPDEEDEDQARFQDGLGVGGDLTSSSGQTSWDMASSSFRLFPVPPNGGSAPASRIRDRTASDHGVTFSFSGGSFERLGQSFDDAGHGLLVEDERDEALVVFASGEVRHRRCCRL